MMAGYEKIGEEEQIVESVMKDEPTGRRPRGSWDDNFISDPIKWGIMVVL